MSATGSISRGHPLVALLAVLGGWVGGRAATWEPPIAAALQPPGSVAGGSEAYPGQAGFVTDSRGGPLSLPGGGGEPARADVVGPGGAPYWRYAIPMLQSVAGSVHGQPAWAAGAPLQPYSTPRHLRDDFALSESLPRFYAPEPAGMVRATPPGDSGPPRARRWSADTWALLRRDESGTLVSPGVMPATYGASQAGGVLRYRLALASPYRPTAYLRTTSTMGRLRETSAALGLSARPFPAFPVIAALEGRLTDQSGQRRVQAAAMAVTELPVFALPMGFRGEAYAQGGYVAGRFATPFADGQFRADRPLVRIGKVATRIGAGVWGGAQKGAARLDAGPSASIAMPLGKGTNGRVALDWRFRIAGDAVPDSGPAVTLSAGF